MDVALRDLVWRRADARCEYCRLPQALDDFRFEIDHIIASKHGGPTSADNLALSCFFCNSRKGPNIAGIDPTTGAILPLFNPRQDQWAEHFEYRGAHILGRTPTGRATVIVLCMNDRQRLAHRQRLLRGGQLHT
jgi:hypothetical protein